MQYVYDGIEIHRGWEDALNKDTVQQSKLSPAYNLQIMQAGSSRFIQVHPGSSRFQAHLCIAVVLYTPKLFCIFTAKEREIYIYIYLFSYIHIYTALQVVVSPLTHRTFTSKFLLLSFQGPNARLVPHNLLTRIPRGL